jgi:hypothetical protein
VLVEVGVHLAQVLVDDLVCLGWGMLFVAVTEGRLLIAELDEFGSWWRHNDMIGSRIEAVFRMLMGVLALSVGIGMKHNMMMMVACHAPF